MINKVADEASAKLLFICPHEVWVKVTYGWFAALSLCRPSFHLLTHVRVSQLCFSLPSIIITITRKET